ncbi:MAG TPA: M50 family metallopeptidase [Polyangiaceae bacterium LLY-WYZ-14_1]|nr:M50 family metallopeptidase [Polyangiaceae bacterium LLY-WYZ-14_1]
MGPLNILLAILGLSVLVIVHESGHYLVARAFGMRVLRYSIGFGPTLWKYKPKDSPTTFQVGAIPFLAYVQIDGMLPSDDRDPNDPGLFNNKSVLARTLTIAAGPAANYALASLLVFGTALFAWPEAQDPGQMIVDSVVPESAAAAAGLEPGDVIVEAQGTPIDDVEDLKEVTAPRAGQATEYIVVRDGERLPPLTMTPRPSPRNPEVGLIGVAAQVDTVYVPQPIGKAAALAVKWPWEKTVQQVEGISGMIQQGTTEGMTGPVGMARIVGQQAERGLVSFIGILAVLSVALGFFNLLPLPALDGGRLMFLVYEVVTRRRPSEQLEAVVHTIGILFLLGVLVLVSIRDVTSPPPGAARSEDASDPSGEKEGSGEDGDGDGAAADGSSDDPAASSTEAPAE